MRDTYFKMIGQKAGNGKMILTVVVDEDFMDCEEIPNIFEVQCVKQAPTIYCGTYPNIKINLETLRDRNDLRGKGVNGILTNEQWYSVKRERKDVYGISLQNSKQNENA